MECDTEDYGFQMLNDDKIVTSVQEESDSVDDEMDEDEDDNESSKGPSNADAFSALETAMEWTVSKSASGIKEIILEVRFPKQKNQRVTFQCEDKVLLMSERIVLFVATLHSHSCSENLPKRLFERNSSSSRHACVIRPLLMRTSPQLPHMI
ncbi:hypothetical protein TNCV_1946571 [Trichonephila clavipes]|uniref:Uncharacterized protein n=1 Tax=Trichonephila clavipes TaxID=2585209 RepID=A0A8X6S9W9_TRICX|nr:hypothetical protein TNCV_1946571 [Trichonephila clavipes]